jgi:hypothetical protein
MTERALIMKFRKLAKAIVAWRYSPDRRAALPTGASTPMMRVDE